MNTTPENAEAVDPSVETLRLALVSFGVILVHGHASGSGDSSDQWSIQAYKHDPEVGLDGLHSDLYYATIPDDGPEIWHETVTKPDPRYKDQDGNPITMSCPAFSKVIIPQSVQKELSALFDTVVSSQDWWDFNEGGSRGDFFWDPLTGRSWVIGEYYYTETVPENDENLFGY